MKPLEGIRILDFTQFMSGPMCTIMLGDFGAEIIKIENPPAGDATRYGNVLENEGSSYYAARNRGKKSIVLNMKDPAQKELFLRMVKTADAVVENFKPGTMEKFGITYEVLEKINPKIVYTSITGYGQDGPYAARPAFDPTVEAEAGLMSINGEEGGKPVKCGAPVADYTGGLVGCIGTLIGIVDAQRTGHGRRVDASMMDALILMYENRLATYLKTGVVPKACGNRYPGASPIGDFMCKDGVPLMINIGTDDQFKNFAAALDQPQWLENPKFASLSRRAQNYVEMEAEVTRVFAMYDSDELIEKLQAHKCVYGKINDFKRLAEHPQVKHRGMIVDAVYPNGVTFKVPGNPVQMSGMERDTEYKTVPLGYNTFEVLSEVADEEELHRIFDPVVEQVAKTSKEKFSKA